MTRLENTVQYNPQNGQNVTGGRVPTFAVVGFGAVKRPLDDVAGGDDPDTLEGIALVASGGHEHGREHGVREIQ